MNEFEKKSKSSYDKKANNYDNTFDGKFTSKFKKRLISTLVLQPEDRLLDVACGNGTLLKQLGEKFNINGYGMDISDNMIKEAKQLNPLMEFHVAPCHKLPFDNDFFHVVTVCASFHHFPNPHLFASEVFRVLKKNGKIHIAEIYLPGFLRVACNPFLRFSKSGDVKFYTPLEILNIFEKNGFSKEKISIKDSVQIVTLQKE